MIKKIAIIVAVILVVVALLFGFGFLGDKEVNQENNEDISGDVEGLTENDLAEIEQDLNELEIDDLGGLEE